MPDVHISAAARADRTAGVVRLVNERKPDLIAITGDFVDGTADWRSVDVAPLAAAFEVVRHVDEAVGALLHVGIGDRLARVQHEAAFPRLALVA